jgi:chromosome segregation ATPase
MSTRPSKPPRRAAPSRLLSRLALGAAGLALLLGAGDAAAQGKVQKVSKKLLERAEDTLKTIGEAEKQLAKVNERYGKLVGGKNVKARRNEHGKVREELKKLEKRAKEVREKSRDMENEASKFFKEWDKGVRGIKDAELQSLSRQSLTESQQKYGQIVTAGRSVADQYDAFVLTLGNQLKYLELDLSDSAIAKLKSSNQDLSGTARELQARVAGLKGEIKRYIAALR